MSIEQADRVDMLLKGRGVRWNAPWNGAAAVAGDAGAPIVLGGGMHLTLLSPTIRELEPLARKWEEFRKARAGDDVSPDTEGDEEQTAREAERTIGEVLATPPQMLVAHSHRDKPWVDRLRSAFDDLALETSYWNDVQAGLVVQRQRLATDLERSPVALLLVSPAALASTFLMQEVLPLMDAAARQDRVRLAWILLEDCAWQETPVASLQCLNPKRPLGTLDELAARDALKGIQADLQRLVADSQAQSRKPSRRTPETGPVDVEALAGRPFAGDRSVPNNASIAFLAESHGKALLVGGDASAEVLAASIRALVSRRGHTRLRLDAFVLPHNGSARNVHRELLELLDCDRYLVSTDGARFRHPDRETIARILAYGRPTPGTPLMLVFNYRSSSTAVWDDAQLKARWNYQTVYPTQESGGILVQI